MNQLIAKIIALKTDRRAVTALEYGIIAGVLGVALLASFTALSGKLTTVFTAITNSI